MGRRLSSKDRKRLLEAVLVDGQSVAAACRGFGVSRQTFYKWKKRFLEKKAASYKGKISLEAASVADKRKKVKRYHRQTPILVEKQIKKLVLADPRLSKYEISKKLAKKKIKISPSGVYKVLLRLGLSTFKKRRQFSWCMRENRLWARKMGTDLRKKLVKKVLKKGYSVSEACRQLGVSRPTVGNLAFPGRHFINGLGVLKNMGKAKGPFLTGTGDCRFIKIRLANELSD